MCAGSPHELGFAPSMVTCAPRQTAPSNWMNLIAAWFTHSVQYNWHRYRFWTSGRCAARRGTIICTGAGNRCWCHKGGCERCSGTLTGSV